MNKLKDYIENVCGGFAKLNSMTKYPPIPVYHEMVDRGRLTDTRIDIGTGPYSLTEKVDGTNARIIVMPHGWVIGSREELLCAEGDLVGNPALGIVQTLRVYANNLQTFCAPKEGFTVFYPEVYGGNTTKASRFYTSAKDEFGAMVFDVAKFSDEQVQLLSLMKRSVIAAWREQDRDRFDIIDQKGAKGLRSLLPAGLDCVHPLQVNSLPGNIEETYAWMVEKVKDFWMDSVFVNDPTNMEGFVVRSADGSRVFKLRFQDYRRTMKALQKA